MTRASETARIISEHINLPVTESALLEETKRPSVIRGKSKDDPEVKSVRGEIKAHFADPLWRHSDEENYVLLRDRAEMALEFLRASGKKHVLVVTHGEILRMMLATMICGEELTPAIASSVRSKFATSNGGITKIQYSDAGWYVLAWNDCTHLDEIRANE